MILKSMGKEGDMDTIAELQTEVRSLAVRDREPHIPTITVYRFTSAQIDLPHIATPYLFMILDGSLRLYTPSGIMDYVPGQYSVSQIDTPLRGTILDFSDQNDFLSLAIAFTVNDAITTVLDIDDEVITRITHNAVDEKTMTAADHEVIKITHKLLFDAKQNIPTKFIMKNRLHEIIYHVLCGSCGSNFLKSIANINQTGAIYQANSWIKENFRDTFSVEDLAEQRNMSVSQFHQRFKSAVGMGPLQCQKRLRLTEARRLMLDEGANVTQAALDVGYESPSQFTRDYRKMFGAAPKEDIIKIRLRLKK